jgi:hypothetical protein
MKLSIIGLVDLRIDFLASPTIGGYSIEEQIKFNSKIPLGLMMKEVFKKQHQQLFQNIDQKIFN